MVDLFRTCISDEDMVHLYRVLYDKAMQGDVSAAKLVLAYKIGKPAPCPNPDAIDRDEWDHYQQDSIEPQEIQLVLGSLPAQVGNAIARTALPILTEARQRELATQLRPECPSSTEVESPTTDTGENEEITGPLPIGKSGRAKHPKQSPNDAVSAATGQRVSVNSPERTGAASPVHPKRKRGRVGGAITPGLADASVPASVPSHPVLPEIPTRSASKGAPSTRPKQR
jgi:hypothetical protein